MEFKTNLISCDACDLKMVAGLDQLGVHTDGLPPELLDLVDGPLKQLLPGGVQPDLPWDRLPRPRVQYNQSNNKSSGPVRSDRYQRFKALKFLLHKQERSRPAHACVCG